MFFNSFRLNFGGAVRDGPDGFCFGNNALSLVDIFVNIFRKVL